MVEILMLRGTVGPNRYGCDPLITTDTTQSVHAPP
jgi:hypothetical protein